EYQGIEILPIQIQGKTVRPIWCWIADKCTVIGIKNAISIHICPSKITRTSVGLYKIPLCIGISVHFRLVLKYTHGLETIKGIERMAYHCSGNIIGRRLKSSPVQKADTCTDVRNLVSKIRGIPVDSKTQFSNFITVAKLKLHSSIFHIRHVGCGIAYSSYKTRNPRILKNTRRYLV